jgi:hypothetical protein
MNGLLRRPRLIAALAFGGAGALLPAMWFLPTILRNHDGLALLLYVGLPGLAAAAAGAALGPPILDTSHPPSQGSAVLRGAGIASVALLGFAPLFAVVFAWPAPGRTTILGLTAAVLLFSVIAVWWVAALVGGLVGWMLQRLATRSTRAVS